MVARARHRQRGQGLLVVLVFLSAFLLLVWASLTLASGAFLGSAAVRADTRTTYALDAGLAYGLEYAHLTGTHCVAVNPSAFILTYTPAISVTVTMTIPAGCSNANQAYTLIVTATGTTRTGRAQIYRSSVAPNPWLVQWEAYQ